MSPLNTWHAFENLNLESFQELGVPVSPLSTHLGVIWIEIASFALNLCARENPDLCCQYPAIQHANGTFS